ncbi:MAG TPA: cytochrome c [Burkholderiales bacterium]|nr:cytochrome c [Burkholderiales bacterium]
MSSATLADSAGAQFPTPGAVPDVLVRQHNTVVYRIDGAAQDYSRNCQGCHGHLGYSVEEIPVLKDRVGYFTRTPAGRAYLVRVPNVAQAHLSDERLARLLNWMLATYSPAQLPRDFVPYTAEEVNRLRREHPPSVVQLRKQVVEELLARGAIPDAAVLSFAGE